MNKIISFKKEISFEAIYQIKSISLEHNISLKEDSLIKGNFIVSGSYKKTEASINIDEFSFELPFEINIDGKYETKDITVDINDFYYEIIDNETLSLNIEIIIENLYEKEVAMDNKDNNTIDKENENNIGKENENRKVENQTEENQIESIFDDMDCNEKYVTYKVYILTENDTLESVIKKNNTKKSILEKYNDLSEIKIGDKIIIPSND